MKSKTPMKTAAHTSVQPKEQVGLVRGLSGWAAMAIVVGTMIGTGIFIVPADMARSTGSAAMVALVWVVGGTLTLFGALSAAELGAALPEAGGTYAYLNRGYGAVWGFIFGWIYCILGAPTSIATIAAGFMRFVGFLFPVVATPLFVWHFALPFAKQPYTFAFTWAQPLAAVAIAVVTFINCLGVRLGGRVQVVLTIIKIAAIVAVIGVGFFLGHGTTANFHSGVAAGVATAGLSGFLTAMVGALWAYDGWINLTLRRLRGEKSGTQYSAFAGGRSGVGLRAVHGNERSVLFRAAIFENPHVARSGFRRNRPRDRDERRELADTGDDCLRVGHAEFFDPDECARGLCDGARRLVLSSGARSESAISHACPCADFSGILASVLALTGTFEDLYSLYIFTVWIFYGLQTVAVIRLLLNGTQPREAVPDVGLSRGADPFRDWRAGAHCKYVDPAAAAVDNGLRHGGGGAFLLSTLAQ